MQSNKKNKKTKILTILFSICYILFGWTIVIPLITTRILCDIFFRARVTPTIKIIDEKYYNGLVKEPLTFKSRKRKLQGGLFYYNENSAYNGLIIVAHGIGCGMNNYLNVVNYFAKKGYLVFSYDMTGVCSSAGPGMIGLQQSAIDLANAVKFVKGIEKTKGLKTFIVGHSLGGYATCAGLNLLDSDLVDAVAAMAGFNKYWDVMEYQGEKFVGPIFALAKIFTDFYFAVRFGKSYKLEAVDGLNKYNKPAIIMHSKNDETVPFRMGIIAYRDVCTNNKVEYIELEDRGHTLYRPIESEKRIDESLIGKETIKRNRKNIFQYQTDKRYCYADVEDVFNVDESILDIIDKFFKKQ